MHLKKVNQSKEACGKASRTAVPNWQSARVMDTLLDQMVSWR